MNHTLRTLLALPLVCLSIASLQAAEQQGAPQDAGAFNASLTKTGQSYAARIKLATEELAATRARILKDKSPLLSRWQELEAKATSLESQINKLKTTKDQDQEKRRQLAKEGDLLRRNLGYLNTLASDATKSLELSVRPGEPAAVAERIAELQRLIESPASNGDGRAAIDIAASGIDRVRDCLGGSLHAGQALIGNDTRIIPGTFALFGPESLFLSQDGTMVGTVRVREGSPLPVVHLIEGWQAASAAPVFQRKQGLVMADATGGKALRLTETKGSLADHIHRGGVVAYAIIGIGLLSLGLIIMKARDLASIGVDSPGKMEDILRLVASGSYEDARAAAEKLKASSRELFLECLSKRHLPKETLEETLDALLTRQRLHAERRLPLLAVIATASPLMGLLGTVMGMVKTFALITVFGTGNAGKLSSGISEVLVTTELGLAVAIPSLVAHGFLSHRIHKHLALLERYAFELVLAVQTAQAEASIGAATVRTTLPPPPAAIPVSIQTEQSRPAQGTTVKVAAPGK